jgi:periplasmic protein TonB
MELQEFCYTPSGVFDGRNKSYGAYLIRKTYEGRVSLAVLLVLVASFVGLAGPVIWKKLFENSETAKVEKEVSREIETKIVEPPKEEELPQPEIKVPPPPEVETIKFLPPEPTPKDEIKKIETPPDTKEIDNKAIGSENKKGDPDVKGETVFEKPQEGEKVTGESKGDENKVFTFAQNDAQFPGGFGEFQKAVRDNFKYPTKARREKIQGRLSVEFVIETDGSITEPKIVGKTLGYGLEEEAIRTFNVIMKSHKWLPAEQNGKKVRLRKTLPISLKLE